jgi:glycosidase
MDESTSCVLSPQHQLCSKSMFQTFRTRVQGFIISLVLALVFTLVQAPPAWANPAKGNLDNDVLYYIAVDRFFDGQPNNNIPEFTFPADDTLTPEQQAYNQVNRTLVQYAYDPSHRYVNLYWGGDLEGVIQKLDYLKTLGVTKLVLSPIQDNTNGLAYYPGGTGYLHTTIDPEADDFNSFYAGLNTAFHGSWTKDWFELEEHFRNPEDETGDRFQVLRRLLNEAGDRGIGIILELNLNSTSPYQATVNDAAFNPSQAQKWLIDNGAVFQQGQKVATYSENTDSNPDHWFHAPQGIDYNHPTPKMLEEGSVGGLPDLNQNHPDVRDYLLNAVRFWLGFNSDGYPISGFYLDSIVNINPDFWQDLENTVLEINPQAVLIGDYADGGYRNQDAVNWYVNTHGYTLLDSQLSQAARRFFTGDRGWDGRAYVLREITLEHDGQYYNRALLDYWIHRILNPSETLEIPRRSLDVISDPNARGWVKFANHPSKPRLFTANPQLSEAAYASLIKFLFVSPEVPLLMYGDETGLAVPYHIDHGGMGGVGSSPFNEPMMIWPEESGWNPSIFQITQTMAHLRQDQPVLRYGETRFLLPEGSHHDQDLFMVREMAGRQEQSESPKVLYAYSTKGGDFQVSLQWAGQAQNVETQAIQGQDPITLHLEPESAQVWLVQ